MVAVTDPRIWVADASVFLAKLFPDEKLPAKIRKLFTSYAKGDVTLLAPVLLKMEIGNAIRSAYLQKRLEKETAKEIFTVFLSLPVSYSEIDYPKTFLLALKHNLSFYDASYLSLALSRKARFLTLDQKLKKAREKESEQSGLSPEV